MKVAVYYKKKRKIAFFLKNWNTEIQRHGGYY